MLTFEQWLDARGLRAVWEQMEVPENQARIIAQFQAETGSRDLVALGVSNIYLGALPIVTRGGALYYEINPADVAAGDASGIITNNLWTEGGRSYVAPEAYSAALFATHKGGDAFTRAMDAGYGVLAAITGGIALAFVAGAGAVAAGAAAVTAEAAGAGVVTAEAAGALVIPAEMAAGYGAAYGGTSVAELAAMTGATATLPGLTVPSLATIQAATGAVKTIAGAAAVLGGGGAALAGGGGGTVTAPGAAWAAPAAGIAPNDLTLAVGAMVVAAVGIFLIWKS